MSKPCLYPANFGIRLSQEDADDFKALAAAQGLSVGVYIRNVLKEVLEAKKEGAQDVR